MYNKLKNIYIYTSSFSINHAVIDDRLVESFPISLSVPLNALAYIITN